LLLLVILFRPGGLISVLVPRRERIAVLGLARLGPRRAQAEAVDGAA
jgi:hypothetical protein